MSSVGAREFTCNCPASFCFCLNQYTSDEHDDASSMVKRKSDAMETVPRTAMKKLRVASVQSKKGEETEEKGEETAEKK